MGIAENFKTLLLSGFRENPRTMNYQNVRLDRVRRGKYKALRTERTYSHEVRIRAPFGPSGTHCANFATFPLAPCAPNILEAI